MSDWFVSSVAHAAVPQFAISTAYSVGNFVRQLAAPAVGSERVFRCTTAGTSAGAEPSWTLTEGSTTSSGSAVFTEVTGLAAYGWSAASARLELIAESWAAAGDRVFVASNHAETRSTALGITFAGTTGSPLRVFSVDPAGSVPPVAADLDPGASITTTGASGITLNGTNFYVEGITFNCGTSGSAIFTIGSSGTAHYFKNCAFRCLTGSGSAHSICNGSTGFVVWDNCTWEVTGTSTTLAPAGAFFWLNTPNAIQGATIPTALFGSGADGFFEVRGVDVSALGANLFMSGSGSSSRARMLVEGCKLHSGGAAPDDASQGANEYEFVNSDSAATNYFHQFANYRGLAVSVTGITHSSGATDGTQELVHQYVTQGGAKPQQPFTGIPLSIWNDNTGAPLTATVEILSGSAGVSLDDDEVWLEVEYLGSSGSPLSSFAHDGIATPLSTPAAQPAGNGTWGGAWNPTDVDDATVSSDSLTATKTAATSGGVRGLNYFSTGLVYFEQTLVTNGGTGLRIGISNAGHSLAAALTLGVNALGYNPSTGAVIVNAATLATIMTATNGDVLGFAVDLTNSKIWIRKNGGNWNNDVIGNQNPATNTGGISLSGLNAGPYYPTFTSTDDDTSLTLNIGASAYNASAPSGFSNIPLRSGQKLHVTFTPQMKGLVRATVNVGAPSAAVFVDPLITLT